MRWNAALYDTKHDFVAEYGKNLLQYIPSNPGQRILDLGCGTGALTERLAGLCGHVLGADSSPEMIREASERHKGIDFMVLNALDMPFENEWDVVFSNAVFHWISDHDALLKNIRRALRPGGFLVCEFGAHGNISRVEDAFSRALRELGHERKSGFNFPSADQFRAALEGNGFSVDTVFDFDRPTPLKDGERGLDSWLRQFFQTDLVPLPEEEQDEILRSTEKSLKSALWDGTCWTLDYRRLRAVARVLK